MHFRRYLNMMLLSGGSLLLELAFTRLFSAVYYPPYVFAIISLAILGIGMGASLSAWVSRLREERYRWVYMLCAAVLSILVLVTLTFATSVPLLIFVLVPLPYVFIGLTFASIFSHSPEHSNCLYMADLVGAGAGAILSIPIMNVISPVNAVLLAAVLFGVVGLYPAGRMRYQAAGVGVLVVLLLGNIGVSWLKLDYASLNTAKPIQPALDEGSIIMTQWDAFGRTDLVKPDDGSPYVLYLDGAAASIMPPAQDDGTLISRIGFFPFATNQPERVMLIGSGGGLDVRFALNANAKDITAVEVNPASIDFVKAFGAYNGGLYDEASVRVAADEGRSLLRRENTLYDMIYLSQVVTLTNERLGYALTENTIYTVEAFQDYYAHLTDSGMVALVLYDEITLTRALSTALAALRAEGMTDAQAIRHMMAFVDTESGRPIPLLMVSKRAFSREDSVTYLAIARQVGFQPLYLPDAYAQPPLDTIESGVHTFAEVIAQSEADISAPTDNRPFFFQFERGVSPDLLPLLALGAVVVVIGGVALAVSQRRIEPPAVRWSPLYFGTLGIGFILIEITIIQQTRIFLGHPAVAVTTSIATLLIGGGIGSWLSGRVQLKSARWPLVGIIVAALLWVIVWPMLSQNLLSLPVAGRIAVTIVCLLPLALFMGMPFPTGLQQAAFGGERQVALAWAVNGVATVVSSIGATALATLYGYQMLLVVGISFYVLSLGYVFLTNEH